MRGARFACLAATLALVGCGNSTDVVGDLTEAEATELAAAVFSTVFTSAAAAPDGPPPAGAGPQAAPFSYTRDSEFTVACQGGTIAVSASLDVEGDTQSDAGRIDYSMTQVHQGCSATSHNGVAFTLDGAPDVTVSLVAENDGQGHIDFTGAVEGRLAFETQRGQGTCDISLAFSGAIDETAQTAEFSIAGVVCRVSVEVSSAIG